MDATVEPLLNVDPEIRGGEPVFMGTRVSIQSLTDWLAGGYSLDDFLENFPTVTKEQVVRFIEAAGELMLERHGAPAA